MRSLALTQFGLALATCAALGPGLYWKRRRGWDETATVVAGVLGWLLQGIFLGAGFVTVVTGGRMEAAVAGRESQQWLAVGAVVLVELAACVGNLIFVYGRGNGWREVAGGVVGAGAPALLAVAGLGLEAGAPWARAAMPAAVGAGLLGAIFVWVWPVRR